MRVFTLSSCLFVLLLSVPASDSFGQAPGSTPQGEMLRGEGIYLRGLGSWELNNAKAMQLNAETMKKIADWNQQYFDGLKREWNERQARQNADFQKREKAERQRQERLRTNPTSDDVTRGDALNALLIDLANPAIQESSWRGTRVPLPPDLSPRSLAFRFAEKAGVRGSQALKGDIIALGRLDMAGHWPGYLPEDKIGPERKAYEAAYKKLSEACEKGEPIIDLALVLDKEIARLKSRAAVAIPADKGYRTAAAQYVAGLVEAARAFQAETMDFASDYIADSHRHKAETVGDLLAFMRKYRLYFAPADKNPDTIATYDALYRLLRQQAQALDLKPGQGLTGPAIPADAFQTGSVWVSDRDHVLTVLERRNDRFKARFEIGGRSEIIREVTGTIGGNEIKWLARDVIAVRGGQGGDNFGAIHGEEISISWSVNGGKLNQGPILKLKRR
jgi:hypothetical protein